MNRLRESQKRGKSPAESFLIGLFDLLPLSCARKLVTCTGVICNNELLVILTVGIWVEPRVYKHVFVPLWDGYMLFLFTKRLCLTLVLFSSKFKAHLNFRFKCALNKL